jgi:uncharacterized membrane protein
VRQPPAAATVVASEPGGREASGFRRFWARARPGPRRWAKPLAAAPPTRDGSALAAVSETLLFESSERSCSTVEHVHPQRALHPPQEPNPALVRHAEERARSVENRVADRITAFSGSMLFVYIHLAWFGCWIGFGVENYPYGLLTMIVSLEAIFLSTFVLISQNRADAKRQVIADQQWRTVKEEDEQNQELLALSHQILELTKAIHSVTKSRSAAK